MKKSELKPGMKVVVGNGTEYIVVSENVMAREGGFLSMSSYLEDLSYRYDEKEREFNVVNIYAYEHEWKKYLPDYLMNSLSVLESLYMEFTLQGKSRIEISGNKTKVLFATDKNPEEIFAGTATCMEGDVYNKKKGIRIATYKALVKYAQSELDKMTK